MDNSSLESAITQRNIRCRMIHEWGTFDQGIVKFKIQYNKTYCIVFWIWDIWSNVLHSESLMDHSTTNIPLRYCIGINQMVYFYTYTCTCISAVLHAVTVRSFTFSQKRHCLSNLWQLAPVQMGRKSVTFGPVPHAFYDKIVYYSKNMHEQNIIFL